jgi:hypothetical protein
MADDLEERKVKALENIAESLDIITEFVEEIQDDEWSKRLQWYLGMWKEKYIDGDKKS